MGLPLYEPTKSTPFLSDPEPDLDDSGILTRRVAGPTPSAKHDRPHRPVNWSTARLFNFSKRGPDACLPWGPPLTDLQLSALAQPQTRWRLDRSWTCPSHPPSKSPRSASNLGLDAREGRDLARSSLCLPRRPSLERQEAFCGERPAKKRCLADDAGDASEDETVAELYRLGLLYDNPHERGERFTFDSIVHDEPLYSINVRPSRRGRKARKTGNGGDSWHYDLPLHLSFAALEDDERLATLLLMTPDEDELASTPELNRCPEVRAVRRPSRGGEPAQAHLKVIYELETEDSAQLGSNSSDTVTDEQNATHSLPASLDFPDLISDSEHDTEELEWDVLNDNDDDTSEPEAWVVLG